MDNSWGPKEPAGNSAGPGASGATTSGHLPAETLRQGPWLQKETENGRATWRPGKWHRLAAGRRARALDNVVPQDQSI